MKARPGRRAFRPEEAEDPSERYCIVFLCSVFPKHRKGKVRMVSLQRRIAEWPVLRQLREGDPLALGKAAQSKRSRTLRPRIHDADHVVHSICPYCAVGCAQLVYVKDGEVEQIEGDPASPISRGRLCPKGAASKSLHDGDLREYKVKYRRAYG